MIFNVGFSGVGEYKTRLNGSPTPEYQQWRSMLQRCYSDRFLDRRDTYRGCSVHPDWHNFQNFAEWYTNHESYGLGYHLDKDLLLEGNKIYSAETCCLIPSELNTLFNNCRASRGEYPQGVCLGKKEGTFRVRMRRKGVSVNLGLFNDIESAIESYRIFKESYVRDMAEEWKGRIAENVYNKMVCWELNK